ncbi:mitochondrial proton/calcium exchanger protein [Vespula pensylvanica]|uniref:mitochondrial proton/calcium exchanger protein n=1 Tax=Vespula pensylvanica TaxID=30213 RepID=UPI001CBA0143|nr:mitochondrial proton/calcium exchanger protein [Vespula pensylvanica]
MNPLIYTKTLMNSHGRIIRQHWYLKSWYSNNHTNCIPSVIYIDVKRPTYNQILIESTLLDAHPKNMMYLQTRSFSGSIILHGQEPSSKIEETVKSIKEQKEQKEKLTEHKPQTIISSAEKAIVEKKSTILQRIKAEIMHYYHGFRLLGLDMKISVKLICRILQGKELSRREHRLLIKTTGDMFRLIPFSVFIIVPFMEFLLPVAIKLFPGLLPSTFQTATEKEDKLKQALKVKIEMAKFLQKTLDDMSLQSSDHKSERAKEFAEFFYKVRTTSAVATKDEIMKFSKHFEDEITLDSLSRPQLIALCRVLDVQTLGTTNFLRFLLRMRLRSLAADDKLIQKEGIDSLTRSELQQACRARAMRAYGLPDAKLKEQLLQWLDLSLIKKVPPSLLLLSRALMVPDTIPMSDKLKATISALPETVVARTKCAIGEKEGKLDHRANIEIIKMEERKIEEERQEQKETEKKGAEPTIAFTDDSKKDEITTTDVKVIEQALDTLDKDKKKMSVEKEELKELKEEMAEYQEDVQELYQIKAQAKGEVDIENIKISKGANRLFNKVNKMIQKMDAVLLELEQSEKQVKEKIQALNSEEKNNSKAVEQLVKIDELIAAIKNIQNVPDEHRLKIIAEILGKIDDDRDGAIKIEDVLKVVELIGKEDVKLNKKQLDELIDMMDKEEILEADEQIKKILQKENAATQELPVSSVSMKPTTKEENLAKEELKDDIYEPKKKFKISSIDESSTEKPTEILKSNSKSNVTNPSLTPSIPPTTKQTEGSKQL